MEPVSGGDGDQAAGAGRFRVTRRGVVAGAGLAGLGVLGGGAYALSKPGATIVDGRPRARAIPSDAMPASVDVVVIGGGNIGTATALALAERGISVGLFEKGVVAGEASGRSFGLIEGIGADPDKMELLARSKQLWPGVSARTGQPTGYVRSGSLFVLEREEDRAGLGIWLDQVRGMPEVDARFIDRAEVNRLLPGLATPHIGGLWQASDAQAEPQLVAPAMALGARAHGARIVQGCAVRGLDLARGRIAGVVTERGRVACRSVVLAGGAWGSLFLRSLGVEMPQFDVGSSSLSVAASGVPAAVGIVRTFAWRQMWNGRIALGDHYAPAPITPDTIRYLPRLLPFAGALLDQSFPVLSLPTFWEKLRTPRHWALDAPSPFERHRIAVSDVSSSFIQHTIDEARAAHPAFRQARVLETWGGFISTTLDNSPVIDTVATVPGLVVGGGISFGLAMAPAIGEALADLATGRTPQVDLRGYRLGRFFDGTKLRFKG